MPRRVQIHPITRRHPAGSVFVGDGTKWATPFKVACERGQWLVIDENNVTYEPWVNTELGTRLRARDLYRDLYLGEIGDLSELRGHDLSCTCDVPGPGELDPCHATVLIDAANEGLLL